MNAYHFHLENHTKKPSHRVLKANSFREAILIVAKTSSIDRNKAISRLPFCEQLYDGKIEGKLTCGIPKLGIDYDCGLFGMCILNNPTGHPKSYCPMNHFPLPDFPEFPGDLPKKHKKGKIVVNNLVYKTIDLSIE